MRYAHRVRTRNHNAKYVYGLDLEIYLSFRRALSSTLFFRVAMLPTFRKKTCLIMTPVRPAPIYSTADFKSRRQYEFHFRQQAGEMV